MKKIIAITIALCLVLGSFSFVFAATEVSNGGWTQTFNNLLTKLTSFEALFSAWWNHFGSFDNTIQEGSFQALAINLAYIRQTLDDFIVPAGSVNTNSITGLTAYEVLDYLAWNIDQSWNSEFAQLNALPSIATNTSSLNQFLNQEISRYISPYLRDIRQSLINYVDGDQWSGTVTAANVRQFAHRQLITDLTTGEYEHYNVLTNGSYNVGTRKWGLGTPLGNLALIMEGINKNFVVSHTLWYSSALTHFNDTLSTWESQGNTLTQVNFTPDSAIQGLYRYLAYTQRDVARLAYVFASDQEIQARQYQQANQTSVLNNFINPNGSGAVGTSDLGAMAGVSSAIKSNFNTGVNASGIFDVFTGSHSDDWFSQSTYNQLMGINSNRAAKSSGSDYPTPLLDERMNELTSIFRGDD